MDEIPISWLIATLVALLLLSAFFSSAETALMALNRVRLKHKAKSHRGARLAQQLLQKPDRLIGLILIGNNFVNILASAVTTVAAIRIAGEKGIAWGTIFLTIVVLIFAEVTPKTFAALHPEKIAFRAAYVLTPLLKIMYPVVWFTNVLSNGLLRLLGVPKDIAEEALSREELKTLVIENDNIRPDLNQKMMINVMDLDNINIEDIMVPRSEIVGIDLNDDWDTIEKQLVGSYLTRLPVYEDDINNVVGTLHIRTVLPLLAKGRLNHNTLRSVLRKPYFVPEGANLATQLKEFQKRERRMGLVVDEYGDVQGLITLDDILEEIVGDFTSEPKNRGRHVTKVAENAYMVDGRIPIRSLNRRMQWNLPFEEASTISGLITEQLEDMPEPGSSVDVNGYHMTVKEVDEDKVVRKVIINPPSGTETASNAA